MTAEKHHLDTVRDSLEKLRDREYDWSSDCGGQLPYDEWVSHIAEKSINVLTTHMGQPQSCAECERLGRENALLREVVRDFAGGIAESDCFNLDKLLQKHADTIAAAGGES